MTTGPANERRSVPRHLRDGEHEFSTEAGDLAQHAAHAPPRAGRAWIALATLLAAALGAWIWFG